MSLLSRIGLPDCDIDELVAEYDELELVPGAPLDEDVPDWLDDEDLLSSFANA